MPTYKVVDWNANGNPHRYKTPDGKYWISQSPSTIMNVNTGKVIKYGNFLRMYTTRNANKTRAPLNSNWNTNTMNLSRVNSSLFSYNTPKAPSYNNANAKAMAVPNYNGNNNANKNANKTRATRKNRKNRRSTRKN